MGLTLQALGLRSHGLFTGLNLASQGRTFEPKDCGGPVGCLIFKFQQMPHG